MDKPPWLEDEPEIKQLLLSFAKRIAKEPLRIKQLSTNGLKPDYFSQSVQGNQSWELLKRLAPDLIDIKPAIKRSQFDPEWSGAIVYFKVDNKAKLFGCLNFKLDGSLY